jgi:ABC-type phosphate transport system substrate-binding protein
MQEGPGDGDAAARFAEQARSTGLALPTSRRLNPWHALVICAIVVASALTVGYATNWMNLSRAAPNPLSELPGCSSGGVSLNVATEDDSSAGLTSLWPELASAFSAATGGCLNVVSAPSSTGFSILTGLGTDGLVGPLVPPGAGTGSLGAATYDVPLMVSPVVVLVNAQGWASTLNLSADALASAYLGTVTSWSSPAFTATNPGLVSDRNVTVVHLAGPSAASDVLSAYLAQWNATFRAEVGVGANVSWPVGLVAAAPSNVTELVAATPGAIGYAPTDVCPTLPTGVICASVQTGVAAYALPTASSVAAAASLEANSTAGLAGQWANVTGVSPENASAYPMVETTFAVLYRDLGTAYGSALTMNESKWLIALFFWVASDTSGTAGPLEESLGYQPLPGGLAFPAEEASLEVTYLGNWILLPPGSLQEGGGEGGEGGETGEF